MKKILVLMLCVLFATLLIGCGTEKAQESTSNKKELTSNTFETPYGNLPIPDSYLENVEVEVVDENPYTIAFYNKNSGVKLYTLYYGEEHGFCIGTLQADEKEIQLYLESGELDESSEGYKLDATLQADINEILDQLESQGTFTKGGQ